MFTKKSTRALGALIVSVLALCMLALTLTAGTFAHAAVTSGCPTQLDTDTCVYQEDVAIVVGPPVVHFTNTFGWTISKTVTPDFWDLSSGGSGNSQYTIKVTKDGGTLAASLAGQVCIANTDGDGGSGNALQGVSVAASLFDDTAGVTITPSPAVLTGPSSIAPDGVQVCYPYHFDIPLSSAKAGEDFDITASIIALNLVGTPTSNEAGVTLPTPTAIHNSITVKDSFNGLTYGPLSDSAVAAQYNRIFSCPSTSDVLNTATIYYDDGNPGLSAQAIVHVTCPKAVPPVPTPTGTTTTTTTTTPGLPPTGSDPNA